MGQSIKQGGYKMAFKCSQCGKALEMLDMSRGSFTVGHMPTLYNGVKCTSCGKYECMACKGSPADKPCSFCGKPVVPAFDR